MAAFRGFVRKLQSGEIAGVYWKMSTDLSRPLVAATGLHDTLDGFITFREAQHAIANTPTIAGAPDLGPAIEALSVLCRHRDWTSDDPLVLGGLLFDACRLYRLMGGRRDDARLGEELMDACWRGIMAFLGSGYLNQPASHHLAFRELGLAIGLRALPIIGDAITKKQGDLTLGRSYQRVLSRF
jgi:hypothetical protein